MNALKPLAPFQALVMSEESRLGREAIETAYALKQLVQAGVRVFFYLEDRERTLDSPTDKIMLSLTAFADELEREKARQRTYDAMVRKARAGHVTGGRVFGYDNVDVVGADGHRAHVLRRINEAEAAVVRRIFELYARGDGYTSIAKRLNAEQALSPKAQQGRPNGWASNSVREVLLRELYRGVIVWNKTRKRNQWGQVAPSDRPGSDWLRVPAPDLQILSDELWGSVQARLERTRARYPSTRGCPPPKKYLLSGLARCGQCGSSIEARSRSHGGRRVFFYGCAGYQRRGTSVCSNGLTVPMEVADQAVLRFIERAMLSPKVVAAALSEALARLAGGNGEAQRLEREISRLTRRLDA
jgi:DNA invertase Pin-like site-specific DNA recombinase